MDGVINASPLIFLSKIDRLALLNSIFETIYIPNAVLSEIQVVDESDVKVNLSGISFIPLAVSNKVAVQGLMGRLHLGEVEVIIGAIERNIGTVVIDESSARNKAKQFGLEVTGTIGILLKAKKLGLIEDITLELINLKGVGIYLSDEIIKQALNSIHL